jgi:hypothetical protein
MSTIYLFNQALTVQALFNLGLAYKNQFRFKNETIRLKTVRRKS